jgi:hypothetical protein
MPLVSFLRLIECAYWEVYRIPLDAGLLIPSQFGGQVIKPPQRVR